MSTTDKWGRTVTVETVGGEDVWRAVGGGQDVRLAFPAGWPADRAIDSLEANAPAQAAAPEVPESVTRFQARAVMLMTPWGAGTLFDAVDAWIETKKTQGIQGRIAWEAWNNASSVTRSGQLVAEAKAEFGLTDPLIDQMFIAAAQIEA